ncbi:hypothetical protein F4821DRAFT_223200 [Hypoxylon rubiginosum]|uniref:Uncharacterized protein n=1 Tax=Hypoxylon rubiginosum TaxID=110542 RepID=A0ACC0DJ17_9PEZI|nr:hypothetical protein F4821DRAFT_223200 [Hypoxylon rubiginosum]
MVWVLSIMLWVCLYLVTCDSSTNEIGEEADRMKKSIDYQLMRLTTTFPCWRKPYTGTYPNQCQESKMRGFSRCDPWGGK